MPQHDAIEVELLPEERSLLLKWTCPFDDVKSQLDQYHSSANLETIVIDSVGFHILVGDLNHAIVSKGCRDEEVIELCERLESIEQSGDGNLDNWY